MKIISKAKNFELTPSLENFIVKKFEGMGKLVKNFNNAEIFVEVEKETNHHRKGDVFVAEAQINLPGKNLVAKEKSDDLFKAIVECKKELKFEVEKYKEKKSEKIRKQKQNKVEI